VSLRGPQSNLYFGNKPEGRNPHFTLRALQDYDYYNILLKNAYAAVLAIIGPKSLPSSVICFAASFTCPLAISFIASPIISNAVFFAILVILAKLSSGSLAIAFYNSSSL
jgi:hypothetical protein